MAFSWGRCIVCQKDTTEELRCPLRSVGSALDKSSVYGSFLRNVSEFFNRCLRCHRGVGRE